MTTSIEYWENYSAPPVDEDAGYTLTDFCNTFGARYHVSPRTMRNRITPLLDQFPGIVIDETKKVRRIYLRPAFVRFFLEWALPRLREGLPLDLIMREYHAIR